jgi:hypothetical protein
MRGIALTLTRLRGLLISAGSPNIWSEIQMYYLMRVV